MCIQSKFKSAQRFADRWGIDCYGDIELFYRSADIIYIASPHETHYQYAKQALEHGKHVLCEKPMGLNRTQTGELFELAE